MISTSGGNHGAVAETIHGGVHNSYFQVPQDASPQEKARIGRRFLDSGQATNARTLLSEVTVHLDDDLSVWFLWLLAFFSMRTRTELSPEDEQQLAYARVRIGDLPPDSYWWPGIDVIVRLYDVVDEPDAAAFDAVLGDLDRLDTPLRQDVLRHLERILQGPLKDQVWQRDVEAAKAARTDGGRTDRVWKFFEPEPAAPRTRPVRPAAASAELRALAGLVTVVALTAVGALAWLGLRRGDTSALIAAMVCLGGAGVALVNGADWRFRQQRQRAGDREVRELRYAASPRGFAGQVDRLYDRYARRYAPDGADGTSWRSDIAVALARLRDELVDVYRETRTPAGKVRWLIEFQVAELRREWDAGTLVDPRRRWEVPPQVRAGVVAGALAAFVAVVWAAQSAMRQDVLPALAALVGAVIAGWAAGEVGSRILAENRRVEAETGERDARLTTYQFEFQRWRHQLSNRPTDMEMAVWLDCDRRMLLDETIRAYQLRWGDVRAYASIEARAEKCRRARAANGPWRYSRYRLLVFLLTADGVRQITVELDFAKATFHNRERTNYRYDAVAAARVAVHDDDARKFQLFLVGGVAIELAVTEAPQPVAGEDGRILAEGAQDATGLRNTLFVLEGVAADGREWWSGPAYRRTAERGPAERGTA